MTSLLGNLPFNTAASTNMHIDLNSCFASIEQQANHFLRGKPVAVAAYSSPNGCILASSVEAKRLGIKTGMRVKDAQSICPDIFVREPDSNKYRYVHVKLKELLTQYTDDVHAKSVDEFALNFSNSPSLKASTMFDIGADIKRRIKQDIGDYITVSIGIAPNRFLAKTASNLQKPDGLCEINGTNFLDAFSRIKLEDICGIGPKSYIKLLKNNISTVLDFYNTSPKNLNVIFHSVVGYYWYLRLRGWEIEDYEFSRKSFGNSYALPKRISTLPELIPIVSKLTEKMCIRMRASGFRTQGISMALRFGDNTYWHESKKTKKVMFDTNDVYKEVIALYSSHRCPKKPISLVAVSCFNLVKSDIIQLNIFDDVAKKEQLTHAKDILNSKWGNFVLTSANMISAKGLAPDRIGFGQIRELDDGGFDGIQVW